MFNNNIQSGQRYAQQPQPWQAQQAADAWQPQPYANAWQPQPPANAWQPQPPANAWQPQPPANTWQPQPQANGWQEPQPQANAWQPQQAGGWQEPNAWQTPPAVQQTGYGYQAPAAVTDAVSAAADAAYGEAAMPDFLLQDEDLLEALAEDEAAQEAQQTEQQPQKRSNSKAAKILLDIVTYAFVVFLIVGSTVFAFSNNTEKSLFGYRFYNVLTPSMEPAFSAGDMIFSKIVKPEDVKVGDVVTFNPSSTSTAFLTHRVVELLPADGTYPARMVTRGDNNNTEDPPVALSAVIGVQVFKIPYMGRVVEMMRNNLLLVCICFAAVFLLITVLRALMQARKQEKKAKAQQQQDDIHALPNTVNV